MSAFLRVVHRRRREMLPVVLLVCVLAAGCMPGSGVRGPENPAGFFMGIWHGWIAPLSLIVGLFDGSIRVYEPHNTGWWYDFGFYMAIIAGFGGLALFRKSNSTAKEEE